MHEIYAAERRATNKQSGNNMTLLIVCGLGKQINRLINKMNNNVSKIYYYLSKQKSNNFIQMYIDIILEVSNRYF